MYNYLYLYTITYIFKCFYYYFSLYLIYIVSPINVYHIYLNGFGNTISNNFFFLINVLIYYNLFGLHIKHGKINVKNNKSIGKLLPGLMSVSIVFPFLFIL